MMADCMGWRNTCKRPRRECYVEYEVEIGQTVSILHFQRDLAGDKGNSREHGVQYKEVGGLFTECMVSSTKAMRIHNKFAKYTVSKQTIAASSIRDEEWNGGVGVEVGGGRGGGQWELYHLYSTPSFLTEKSGTRDVKINRFYDIPSRMITVNLKMRDSNRGKLSIFS